MSESSCFSSEILLFLYSNATNFSTMPNMTNMTNSYKEIAIEDLLDEQYNRRFPALTNYDTRLTSVELANSNEFYVETAPVDPRIHYAIGIIHVIFMIVAIIGHLLKLFLSKRFKSYYTNPDPLRINLEISDFLTFSIIPILIYNSFYLGPAAACIVYGFFSTLSSSLSITTTTAITIDQYHNLLHPVRLYLPEHAQRVRIKFLIFIWVISLFFAICPLLDIGLGNYSLDGLLTTCGSNYLDESFKPRVFMCSYIICIWIVPFIINLYYIIYSALLVNKMPNNTHKYRLQFALLIMILTYLSWVSFPIIGLIGLTNNIKWLTPLETMIPGFLSKLSACLDPYIYSIMIYSCQHRRNV